MRSANFVVAIVLVITPAHATLATDVLSKDDALLLVDNLLKLSDKPADIKGALAEHKKWEAQYIRISEAARLGPKQLALYFFVIFIADARVMVDTQEETSHEILPLYESDKERFVSVLNNNPAFIVSVCGTIGDHFIIEGKINKLSGFISNNKPLIEKHLYKPNAITCLSELEKRKA